MRANCKASIWESSSLRASFEGHWQGPKTLLGHLKPLAFLRDSQVAEDSLCWSEIISAPHEQVPWLPHIRVTLHDVPLEGDIFLLDFLESFQGVPIGLKVGSLSPP